MIDPGLLFGQVPLWKFAVSDMVDDVLAVSSAATKLDLSR